jgi:hypothetical protein
VGTSSGRAIFAPNFVIAFASHPHVRKLYTPVRAKGDFALSIKNPSGQENDLTQFTYTS